MWTAMGGPTYSWLYRAHREFSMCICLSYPSSVRTLCVTS
jgi:hypothetical protein